ncbi:unnamed protein product [Heterobilharzia americana]|nr:unnamed protein product [Heterobilharzia americana]
MSITKMKLIHILSSCFLVFSICLQAVNSQPWNPQLEKLLKMHNDYRHMLMECKVEGQPPAKYLPDLKWDNDLASYAQSLADECYFHHNDVHLSKYKYVGQNIAGYQTVEKAMYEWFIEYKDYTFATGYCSRICGHYTQVSLVKWNIRYFLVSVKYVSKYYAVLYHCNVQCINFMKDL